MSLLEGGEGGGVSPGVVGRKERGCSLYCGGLECSRVGVLECGGAIGARVVLCCGVIGGGLRDADSVLCVVLW